MIRRRCSANIPDAPTQSRPAPVEAPKLELQEDDPKQSKKRKKRLGKQALRLTGLTIGAGSPTGSGLRAP